MKQMTHGRSGQIRTAIGGAITAVLAAGLLSACSDSGADGDEASPAAATAGDQERTSSGAGAVESSDGESKTDSETDMPSTAHAPPGEPVHTNRLVNESSPYLLQHAHNPVNWYPWGSEAFEAARAQNKPIFMSIGYSTCYWCHVMERESFENETVAAFMNEHFICIKVDREERPDVDDIYMAATQGITGRGGWPMSVFLEPVSLKPFQAGTYFPTDRFMQLLAQMSGAWTTRHDQVMAQADSVAEYVTRRLAAVGAPKPLEPGVVDSAVAQLMRTYDRGDAGFGRAPKFPQPILLELLIGAAWDELDVQRAVLHTLDRMAMGGMYDQIGGGFHRYSTDGKWLVPHFEKMTYDNGQLASVYAEAYERTQDPFYAEIVHEIFRYVSREMIDDRGAFWSAQDAEVDAREGLNYLWVQTQIEQVLSDAGLEADIPFALDVYGFTKGTNFRDPHHPEDGFKNVVHLVEKPASKAESLGMTLDEFNERIERINAALLVVRDTRERPGTDDKVLSGWNGLMIAGMADAGRVLGESSYIQTAARAAEFVMTIMRENDGGLLRNYREGRAKVPAFLEDYAFMTRGLIALYHATDDQKYVDQAEELVHLARERFWDDLNGAYFDTLADQDDLFVRGKSYYDGAVPCGNSVMILGLLDLYEITAQEDYLNDAVSALEGLNEKITQAPVGTALCTLAVHRLTVAHPDRLAGGPDPGNPFVNAGNVDGKVNVGASVQKLNVGGDGPATFDLTLSISEPYHINANLPGQEGLFPLEVILLDGAGVELEVVYPEGELFDDAIRVHTGTVTVPVIIRKTGEVTGNPRLQVTYQTCSGRVCYLPKTEDIPVELKFGD